MLNLLGSGLLINLPLILLLLFLRLVVFPIDDALSPLVSWLIGRHIPMGGLILACIYLILSGFFASTVWGNKILKFLASRSFFFSLAIESAEGGKQLRQVIRACKEDSGSVNIVLAPFFVKERPWPFIITRVLPTADPERPIIFGVFLDTIPKPLSICVDDEILLGLNFKEAIKIAYSAAVSMAQTERPLETVRAGDYIKRPEFKKFFNNGGSDKPTN